MCNFQVATSQVCNFPSGNFPKVRLGPLRRCRLQWGRALRLGWAGGRVLRLGQTWEVAAWEIAHLWKLPFGKISLGSCHLGKILWESTKHESLHLPTEKKSTKSRKILLHSNFFKILYNKSFVIHGLLSSFDIENSVILFYNK